MMIDWVIVGTVLIPFGFLVIALGVYVMGIPVRPPNDKHALVLLSIGSIVVSIGIIILCNN